MISVGRSRVEVLFGGGSPAPTSFADLSLDRRGAGAVPALRLDAPPRRIECYDISNFQGDHFVGSMVVCEDGQMNKSEYRRFKIRYHENKPDDVAMIREVLTRRLKEGKLGNPKFNRMPDLIIVDGGRGQLSSAVAAMEATGT